GRHFCSSCGKEYRWMQSLVRHEREEIFVCGTCGKTYKWKESLQQHRRLECGIEPKFCCIFCGRRFKHKHHLKEHVKRRHHCNQLIVSR
ncbi:Longitudinals lacking protein, isoforms A/B/D/L, partial [Habropoda laboriosa]